MASEADTNAEEIYLTLQHEIEYGTLENFRRIADANSSCINYHGEYDLPHLSFALLRHKSFAWISTLVEEYYADVNAADFDGWTPIMFAAMNHKVSDKTLSKIKLLVEHRADVTSKTTSVDCGVIPAGSTLADMARIWDDAELTEFLSIKPAPTAPPLPPLVTH